MSQNTNPARYTISYADVVANAESDEQPTTWHVEGDGVVRCGAFTMDAHGVVEGPAAYMRERGSERLRRIEAGEDYLVNFGLRSGLSPNAETAVLVSLQTDYAAWLGEREMLARQEAARASQKEFMARMEAQRAVERKRGRRR